MELAESLGKHAIPPKVLAIVFVLATSLAWNMSSIARELLRNMF